MMRAVACRRLLRLHHQPLDVPESQVVKLGVSLDGSNEVLRPHLPRADRGLSDENIRPKCAPEHACANQTARAYHAGLNLISRAQLHHQRDHTALDEVDVLDRTVWHPKYVVRLERPHPTFDFGENRYVVLRHASRPGAIRDAS